MASTIPTHNGNWGQIIESAPVFKETGDEVAKATKARPAKSGASPLFYYVNASGNKGAWYKVSDLAPAPKQLSKDTKEVLKSITQQEGDAFKEYKTGAITVEQFNAKMQELAGLKESAIKADAKK